MPEPALDPDRFRGPADDYPDHWRIGPRAWDELPEDRTLAAEIREQVAQAVASLSPAQKEVITLRDIEGWTAREVSNALGVSDTNQRVLLHRARSKVRRRLERYLDERGEKGT